MDELLSLFAEKVGYSYSDFLREKYGDLAGINDHHEESDRLAYAEEIQDMMPDFYLENPDLLLQDGLSSAPPITD